MPATIPLQDICVSATPAAGGFSGLPPVTTDPNGSYSITGLTDGDYKVQFSDCSSAPTYAPIWFHDKADRTSADSVSVANGAATNNIDQQMVLGATISGHVTDDAGTPTNLAGICVYAEQVSDSFGPPAATATTAADGTYSLPALQSGSYKVHFDPTASCSPDAQPQNYLEQYFDGKSDAGSATVITLAAGATRTGVDAKLSPGATISGTVTDTAQSPQPLENVCLTLTRSDDQNSEIATGVTDASGHYTLNGIPAGSYKLDFESCGGTGPNVLGEWWNNQPSFDAATTITLTSGQSLTGTDAQLAPGASISGHVTDSEATPNDLSGICVDIFDAAATVEGPHQVGSTATNGSGQWSVTSLPAGDYKVQFSSGCGAPGGPSWVSQWWNDQSSFAAATPISLAAGGSHTGTDAQLQPGTTISGHVKNSSNEPVSGMCVGAVPFNGSANDFFGPDAHSAQTDDSGNYTIDGLPVGDYKVGFQDCGGQGYVPQYYANQSDFASATKVTTSLGAPQTGIDATVQQPGSISGHVANASNQAVENECVDAFAASTDDGPGMFTPVASDETGVGGNYRFDDLPPGEYKVRFHDCGTGADYASQTYNGQGDLTSATHVTVTGGNTTTGINATLAPGASIAGNVQSAGGRGIDGVCVSVVKASTGDVIDGTTTSSNGSYDVPGVPAGDYKVQFTTAADSCAFSHRLFAQKWFNQQDTFAAADTVSVAAGDFRGDVNATLTSSGGSISGHVTAANGGASVSQICVSAQSASGSDFDDPWASTQTDSSGNYVLEGLSSGSYKVSFQDCSDNTAYVFQYYNGASDFAGATAVAVSGTSDHPGIDASLVGGGTITGHVGDGTSANVSDVCVSALRLVNGTYQNEQSSSTGTSGDYAIHNLPAGTYKVDFSDCDQGRYVDQWWQNQPDQAHATQISVSADTTTPGISATMVVDQNAPPETTITSGPAEGEPTASTTAHFAFASSKPNSTFECKLDNDPSFTACTSPKDYSGLAAGDHHLQVRATDSGAHTDPTPASRTWTVDSTATTETTSGTAPSGGTVSSNPAATDPSSTNQDPVTSSNPVEVGVTSPSGGTVSIVQQPASSTPSPTGFTGIGGQQITISAPTASVSDPLRLVFVIDASAIPSGTDKSKLTVVRSGTDPAADCLGSTTASPDPCVTARTILDSGDVRLVVLAVHTSPWTFATAAASTGGGDNSGGNSGGGGDNSGTTTPPTTTTTPPTGNPPTSNPPVTPPVTPATAKCKVPNLKGKTVSQVKTILKKAHCKLGKVTKAKAPKKAKAKKGRVFKQSPAAGAKKPSGTKVSVVLAK